MKNFHNIKNKVTIKNVTTYYQIANCFKFDKITKPTLCYIQRYFALVSEEESFSHLDFTQIAKIVSSSQLNIHSELEVLSAIDAWVSYDFDKRSKFAVSLLLKVRFDLLSDQAMSAVLNCDFVINKINDCILTIKDILKNRKKENKPSNSFSIRHCSQTNFSFIITGGCDWLQRRPLSNTKQIDAKNFNVVKDLASMNFCRKEHKSVYCRGAVYVFKGYDDRHYVNSVEKYCLEKKTWEKVAEMKDIRSCFCVCAFMDQIYIVGGKKDFTSYLNTCLKLDTKSNSWSEVKEMNQERANASCSVFEGKIVVAGGMIRHNEHFSTVEAYDHMSNKWSPMPNMIEGRSFHASVAIKNKLFIIGSFSANGIKPCEIFDSKIRKFVLLKQVPSTLRFKLANIANTSSIGNKFVSISYESSTALCYDVEKDEWSEETFDVTKKRRNFCCALTPKMTF